MDKALEHLLNESSRWAEKGKSIPPAREDSARGPRELHFELTYHCNQKCVMCDIWPRYRRRPQLKEKELVLDDFKKLLSSSSCLGGVELVLFSGGEPFLRPDLPEIAALFARSYPGARLVILSNCLNGTLIAKSLDRFFREAPSAGLMIGTSLDGKGETHDRIRGTPGAFQKLASTLAMLRSRFPGVNLETNFTITPSNFRDLLPASRFAREAGAGFTAQFPIPWEGTAEFQWSGDDLARVREAATEIEGEILRTERPRLGPVPLHLVAKLRYWEGLLDYQARPRRLFPHCPAGDRYAMFSPQGDLYFCPKLKNQTAGNIRETPFDEIWRGEKAARVRHLIRSGGCHCWLNCTAYVSITQALERGMPTSGKMDAAVRKTIGPRAAALRAGFRRRLPFALQALVSAAVFPYLLLTAVRFWLRRRLNERRPAP
jgi:MoaA/NifB/PqqE/SkfB family radical SAM enzyme